MSHTVFVIGHPAQGPVTVAQLDRLHSEVQLQSTDLIWGAESFSIPPEPGEHGDANRLILFTNVQQEDHEGTWRDMSQCMALCIVCSKVCPDWLWMIEDDGELWANSDDFEQNSFWFQDGHAVRVSDEESPHTGVEPDNRLQAQVRSSLADSLPSALASVAAVSDSGLADEPAQEPSESEPADTVEVPTESVTPVLRFVNGRARSKHVPTVESFLLQTRFDAHGAAELLGDMAVRTHVDARSVLTNAVFRNGAGQVIGQIDGSIRGLAAADSETASGGSAVPCDVGEIHSIDMHVRIDTENAVKTHARGVWQSVQPGESGRRAVFFVDIDHRRHCDAYELRARLRDAEGVVRQQVHQTSVGDTLGVGPQVQVFTIDLDEEQQWCKSIDAQLLEITKRWYDCGSIDHEGTRIAAAKVVKPTAPARAPKPQRKTNAAAADEQTYDFSNPKSVAQALRSKDERVILVACEAVAFAALYEVTSRIRPLFGHRSASVRAEACRAMAVIGKPEHLGRLEALLDDAEPGVRAAAMEAIDAITRR